MRDRIRWTPAMIRQMEAENKQFPAALVRLPDPAPYPDGRGPVEAWRSRAFLLQVYAAPNGFERLSINRTKRSVDDWLGGITWDDLQRLKRECGRGDRFAYEVFPPDSEVVNVAAIRHLWVLPAGLILAPSFKHGCQ